MGTRMLLFPGDEHMHRAPSWGGMHEPDMGTPSWMSAYSQSSSGGNTWSKRLAANSSTNTNTAPASDSDSWEVRAFAEDASTSGQWPPRSYSCSFCQREFRTAQALGGHMNVHRRERAHANQMAQLRTTEAPSHSHHHHSFNYNHSSHNNVVPPAPSRPSDHLPHHHWLPRDSTHAAEDDDGGQQQHQGYQQQHHHRHTYEDSFAAAPATSPYGAFRQHSSSAGSYHHDASPWRSSPYETSSSRDAGLDLELRLGQRYD